MLENSIQIANPNTYKTYTGQSGTIENTVEAPAYVTDWVVNELDITKITSDTTVADDITVDGNDVVIHNVRSSGALSVANQTLGELCPNLKDGDVAFMSFVSENPYVYLLLTVGGKGWNNHTSLKITSDSLSMKVGFFGEHNKATRYKNLCIVKGDSYRGFIPYGGGTVKTTDGNGNENELFLSPDTPTPVGGLKTFDGTTNVISDFDVSLKYFKNKEQSVPAAGITNDINKCQSKIHIGLLAPTDNFVNLWIKPNTYPISKCSFEEILTLLAAHYADEIDITKYWHVGDMFTVPFAGTAATDTISTAQPACLMPVRIIGTNHDDLVTPINGHTKAVISWEFAYSLPNKVYIWGTSANLQDTDVWSNNPLRAWLNSDDFKGALPTAFASAIKSVVKVTKSPHSTDTTETTNDSIFLLSVYEVYKDINTNFAHTTNKIAEGSQYKFYETLSNRIATDYYVGTDTRAYHWLRSPASYYNSSIGYHWCSVYSESSAANYNRISTFGLAPAGAM